MGKGNGILGMPRGDPKYTPAGLDLLYSCIHLQNIVVRMLKPKVYLQQQVKP